MTNPKYPPIQTGVHGKYVPGLPWDNLPKPQTEIVSDLTVSELEALLKNTVQDWERAYRWEDDESEAVSKVFNELYRAKSELAAAGDKVTEIEHKLEEAQRVARDASDELSSTAAEIEYILAEIDRKDPARAAEARSDIGW